MSNALKGFSLLRPTWMMPPTYFTASFRQIHCNRGVYLQSENVEKSADSKEIDPVVSILKSANSTANIFRIVCDNHRRMDEKQSLLALRSLFTLQKEGKSNFSTRQLISHPDFEKLCRNIKRYSGVLEVNDAIEAIKILNYVGVPSSSTITQVLLQIVRCNINSLNVPHILFLDYILKSLESTPLVEALKIALPIVLDINVRIKLNVMNALQMAECLQYAIKYNLSEESIDYILKKIEEYPKEFDGSTAASILISICSLPRNSRYKNLVNKASTDLVVNIDDAPGIKMELVLSKLAHSYTNYYSFYYQEVLFDTCANFVVDRDKGLKRAVAVLRNLARMRHHHKRLLDYVSTYIYENPTTEKNAVDIYSIAVALILSDYRPVHWDHLKEWIRGSRNLAAENRKEILWIRFAAALCLLNIYKIDVLTRALQKEYISHLLEKPFYSNYENYFIIWQCITTYKPDFIELLHPEMNPKDIVKKGFQKNEFPLKGALHRILGGEEFVLTNLYSKLGIQIDHAIIFENSSPVLFETGVEFVEDIKLDNSSKQLVLIWVGSNLECTMNTKQWRPSCLKTLSILEETLKCNVIPINGDRWNEKSEPEKIPYLIDKIKMNIEFDINVSESSV